MDAIQGVYFRREDYAGFWRRLWVDVIDTLIIGTVCLGPVIAFDLPLMASPWILNLYLAICAIVGFCYFVVLKRSKAGTVGYLVCGVRILGLDGRPARLRSLTFRTLFAVLGPLCGLESVWIAGDPHRQTLRDKFAQTYVVKRKAVPAGTGKVIFGYYEICCYHYILREVEVETTPPVLS
ncbi:MAG TPA: RDD family protein [Bryobacteraceae bacterium]